MAILRLRVLYRCLLTALLAFLLVGHGLAQESDEADLDSIFEPNQQRFAEKEKLASLPVPEIADQQELCVFFHQRGVANSWLGRYGLAIADMRQALALHKPSRLSRDQWCDRWRLQSDLGAVLDASGDLFGKIEHFRGVAQEARQSRPHQYFMAQNNIIGAYISLGMLREANETFRLAEAVLPEVRQHKSWPRVQHGILGDYNERSAKLLELRGNHRAAEPFYRAAVSDAKLHLQTALRMEGENSQWTRGSRKRVANDTRLLAANLSAQGRLGEAEFLAQEALNMTLAFTGFNTTESSNALSVVAANKLQQGKVAEAARYSDLAIKALERAAVQPYSTRLASRRSQMGLVLGMQGRWQDALRIFEARDRGLRSNPEQFARHGSNDMDWAVALLNSGQAATAEKMLRNLLESTRAKAFVDPFRIALLQGYLAVALTERGQREEALALFKKSLPLLFRRVGEVDGDEEAGFVVVYRVRALVDGYLELLSGMVQAGTQAAGFDVVSEAFKAADIARYSSVQRAVTASAARATLPDADLAQLARREQDAGNQLHALNKILVRLAGAPEAQRLPRVMDEMQQDIKRLTIEQMALKKTIADSFPDYSALISPQPASPADIQGMLRPDEAVVTLYCAERNTYVWTITKSAVSFRSVPISREKIAAEVASVLRGVDLSGGEIKDFDVAAANRLYQSLLAPDAAKWESARVLNVIPHGALGQLPFAMLLTGAPRAVNGKAHRAYAELPWLVSKIAIAQQSSVSGFIALRRQNVRPSERRPFIGFGDPLFNAEGGAATQRSVRVRNLRIATVKDKADTLIEKAQQSGRAVAVAETAQRPSLAQAFAYLPALPDTTEELVDIAKATGAEPERDLFLGSRATEQMVKRVDLSGYRVIAFATHGLKSGELGGLDQPALALSNPALTEDKDNDGFLTLDEVLGLRLNADWVVLSACNTASADGDASEAVSGLGRAFFYAGTRSLLVSNWAVETVSARLLTTALFRQQAMHHDMPRAVALRRAMLAVMADKSADYTHPVFWAPFTLVGDGWGDRVQ